MQLMQLFSSFLLRIPIKDLIIKIIKDEWEVIIGGMSTWKETDISQIYSNHLDQVSLI